MTETFNGSPAGGFHRALTENAIRQPVDELTTDVLALQAGPAGDWAGLAWDHSAINSAIMVETAAEHRTPTEIADLVAKLAANGVSDDLARLALDAAAATRTPTALAVLADELVKQEVPGQVDVLLAAVVRRRLPRDAAELLTILGADNRTGLGDRLTDELARDAGRVLVLLWLRAEGHGDLAGRAAERIAKGLAPADLAVFIRTLRTYRDTRDADAAISGALGQDPRVLADMIVTLRGDRADRLASSSGTAAASAETAEIDEGDAASLIRAVLGERPVADLCVLASWLSSGPWREGAQIIWRAVTARAAGADLVDTLSAAVARSGNLAGALDGVRQAARSHSAEDVALLITEVEGRIEGDVDGDRHTGYATVLDTVARHRTIADIFEIAARVTGRGYNKATEELLGAVEEIVHQRPGDEIAEFLDLKLARGDTTGQRGPLPRFRLWQPGHVLLNVALNRDPGQMMYLIRGLSQRGRYADCRKWVERGIGDHYDGPLLAALPLVLGRDQLPLVLRIFAELIPNPNWIRPEDFPDIARALPEAGATREQRHSLFTYAGGCRWDYQTVVEGLRKDAIRRAGPGSSPDYTEANWVREGHRYHPGKPDF